MSNTSSRPKETALLASGLGHKYSCANSTGEFTRTCSGEREREKGRGLSARSLLPRAPHPSPRSWIHGRPQRPPERSGEKRMTPSQKPWSLMRRVLRRKISNYCSCRSANEYIPREKLSKSCQKNHNRMANMAALWRQRNLRSRWRVRQYKEATYERRWWHPRHQPMNWRDSIRASDNRHTQGGVPKAS